MRNFRELEICSDSIKLVGEIYEITKSLPESEKFGLISQMNRSAISIPSNIAEGSAKDSQKDFVRFLKIALGSAFELETHLEICYKLGFLDRKNTKIVFSKLITLQKRIGALSNYAIKL